MIIRQLQDDSLRIFKPDLQDYKFFCFNGEVKFFKIDYDRFVEHHANYYDLAGMLLPFGEKNFPRKPDKKIELPASIKRMAAAAEKIAKGNHFVRVDFYSVFERVYFGEITFFPASGMGKFEPEEWDYRIGQMIDLS